MAWWDEVASIPAVEVLVVGAGSAGSTASIAAARAGARVCLVDKLPFLGGTSTAVLDTFYGFYTPGSASKKVVGGIADEVVYTLEQLGPVVQRPNTYGAGTGITYNSEHLKVAWESLVDDAHVRVLQHSLVQDVRNESGRITAVLLATKAGLRQINPRVVIDCSGDADVCNYAGYSLEVAGELDPAQSLTTTFKLVGVDSALRATITKDELHALMSQAADAGYVLPRKEGSDHITPIEGMTATVMTRIPSYVEKDGRAINVTDPEYLSWAEHEGRRQAVEYTRFLVDCVPGYANASLVATSTQVGVRETRRVYGDYRLTRDDVLSARQFDDQIGLCGAPIEDHKPGEGTGWTYLPDGEVVGIPLRSLIVKDAENVLMAGRCFSATHDAHASVRSMGQCMAMGQAAGVLAAMAVKDNLDVRAIHADRVRDDLRTSGAIVEI